MVSFTNLHTHVHTRFCGYILESARGKKPTEKKFLFHGFKMEPNTDKLCLTLHTACQARYQHVLDAHPEAVAQQRIRDREVPCVAPFCMW